MSEQQEERPLDTGGMVYAPMGIGGWLVLPPIHLLIDIGLFFYLVWLGFGQGAPKSDSGTAPVTITESEWASLVFCSFDLLLAIYAVFCLVRLFQKRKSIPELMTWFYLMVLLKAVANVAILHSYPELGAADKDMFSAWKGVAQGVVAGIVWISYFHVSVRVKNTFVH